MNARTYSYGPFSLGALLLVLSAALSPAATPYTESFTGGLSGWTNNPSVSVQWSNISDTARARFFSGFPGSEAILMAGAGASGGAFVGDYASENMESMGFSVRVDKSPAPSSIALKWQGGGFTFERDVWALVTQTGVWYRFAFSLASKSAGGWSGGTEEQFQQALTNVTAIWIVAKPPFDPIDILVDDIFITSQPQATRFQATTNGYADITWSYVRSNYTYNLEYSTNLLLSGWSTTAVVTANSTSLVSSILLTNAPMSVYRLFLP